MNEEIQVELSAMKLRILVLQRVIDQYNAAADKFIQKVEDGRAHSRETYADLKAARQAAGVV
jgi:hypothetical protein